MMKINFTKKEYRALLDLIEIANWVIHAHAAPGKREETEQYDAVIQKVLSFAKEMGLEDLIKQDKETQLFWPTKKYEEHGDHMQIIDLYDDDVFWDGLSFKLSLRDLINQEGEEAVEKMDFSERGTKLIQLQEWYDDELDQNGLQNVKLDINKNKRMH